MSRPATPRAALVRPPARSPVKSGAARLAVPALLATLGLGACVTAPAPYPFPPVPAPIAETVPLPPVSADPLIWRPGSWDWTGTGYAWSPGRYERRGTHSNQWLPGAWQQTPNGYAWVPGHWL